MNERCTVSILRPEAVIRTSLVSVKWEKERNHNRNESQLLPTVRAQTADCQAPSHGSCWSAALSSEQCEGLSLAGTAPFRYGSGVLDSYALSP